MKHAVVLGAGSGFHLFKVAVKIVNCWLAIEAKIAGATALQYERPVKQGECVGRGAMNGGTDGDAALAQAPHNSHHLQALHALVQNFSFKQPHAVCL